MTPPLGGVTSAESRRIMEVNRRFTGHTTGRRDDENIILVTVDDDAARDAGIHTHLWILSDGRIAEATVNQPPYFDTLADLLAEQRRYAHDLDEHLRSSDRRVL